MTRALIPLFFLAGCETGKIALGAGEATDARLIADLYTWECDDGVGIYEGVFSYYLSLEYAPDGLVPRDLPASGCSAALDLFPDDAGANAHDIEDTSTPSWSNGSVDGVLAHDGTGFYFDDVFSNQRTCSLVQDVQGNGTGIDDAGVFSGVSTPVPSDISAVHVSGLDPQAGVEFGEETNVNWEAGTWDESYVQVRREQGGVLVESVTCNTTGMDGFTVDDAVWDLMSSFLDADVTNLYVGFQNKSTEQGSDGQKIDVVTRVNHVAVVQD